MEKLCPFFKVPCLKNGCMIYYTRDDGTEMCTIESIAMDLELQKVK